MSQRSRSQLPTLHLVRGEWQPGTQNSPSMPKSKCCYQPVEDIPAFSALATSCNFGCVMCNLFARSRMTLRRLYQVHCPNGLELILLFETWHFSWKSSNYEQKCASLCCCRFKSFSSYDLKYLLLSVGLPTSINMRLPFQHRCLNLAWCRCPSFAPVRCAGSLSGKLCVFKAKTYCTQRINQKMLVFVGVEWRHQQLSSNCQICNRSSSCSATTAPQTIEHEKNAQWIKESTNQLVALHRSFGSFYIRHILDTYIQCIQ